MQPRVATAEEGSEGRSCHLWVCSRVPKLVRFISSWENISYKVSVTNSKLLLCYHLTSCLVHSRRMQLAQFSHCVREATARPF